MALTPLPAFSFQVEWGGTRTGFAEVLGLDVDINVIRYREGDSPETSAITIAGLPTWGKISLKRGIVAPDNDFWVWIRTALQGLPERRDVTIAMLDATHQPVKTWKVRNAIPVALRGPHLDASASAIAIEELILAHEGFQIEGA